MQVKDQIIKKIAEELQFDVSVVETVISWSFKKANEATKSNKEVELSGIGKLQLSQAKLRKNIDKLEKIFNSNTSPEMKVIIEETLKDLKTKVDVRKDKRNN